MKKYFVTGLVILLPLAVTIAIIALIINFLTKPFMGIVASLLSHFDIVNRGFLFLTPEQVLRYGSQILILLTLFFVTVFLGMITSSFIVNSLFRLGDKIIHRIPVVNTVYKTSQDIIKTLFVSDKNSFKQVVMVPFPRDRMFAMGLVSRESPHMCSDAAGEDLISVLIPTTPNPTTGFLLMYPRKDLIFIDMKPEDAIKYIVSCGVIVPEALAKPKAPLTM
jgi:uncharacterized membrane protein